MRQNLYAGNAESFSFVKSIGMSIQMIKNDLVMSFKPRLRAFRFADKSHLIAGASCPAVPARWFLRLCYIRCGMIFDRAVSSELTHKILHYFTSTSCNLDFLKPVNEKNYTQTYSVLVLVVRCRLSLISDSVRVACRTHHKSCFISDIASCTLHTY